MKKVLCIVAALTLGFASIASAQFRIGGRLGAGMASMSNEKLNNDNKKPIFSFQAGVQGIFTLPLSLPVGALEIESGVFLNRLGTSYEDVLTVPEVKVLGRVITKELIITTTRTTSIYALTIPLDVNYSIPIVSSFGLYLGTGPQVNIAMSGSHKHVVDTNGDKDTKSKDLTFGENGGPERMTMDWRFQAGAQILNNVRAGMYFDLGLSSHHKEYSIKNQNYGLSLSYLF